MPFVAFPRDNAQSDKVPLLKDAILLVGVKTNVPINKVTLKRRVRDFWADIKLRDGGGSEF